MRLKKMIYLCLLMAILSYPVPLVRADDPLLFWADFGQDSIYRSELDGNNPQVLVDRVVIPQASGGNTNYLQLGVAVDSAYIYWTDTEQDSIYRSARDGSNPQVLVDVATIPLASGGSTTHFQTGVAVDNTYIYWADVDQGSIYRSALDGSNPQVLVDVAVITQASGGSTTYFQGGVAVDRNYIYWVDHNQDSIYRSALDGSNPQVLVDEATIPLASGGSTAYNQVGLAVDNTYIYWADSEQDSIYRSALDGSNPQVLVDRAAIPLASGGITTYSQRGLAVDNTYIYWADADQDSIYRSVLDGSNPQVLVDRATIPLASGASMTYIQWGIAVFVPQVHAVGGVAEVISMPISFEVAPYAMPALGLILLVAGLGLLVKN